MLRALCIFAAWSTDVNWSNYTLKAVPKKTQQCQLLKMIRITLLILVLSVVLQGSHGATYHGIYLGEIGDGSIHKVSGKVYLSNKNELHLVDFNYDGAGPDAFFMIVKEGNPSAEGIKLADENGSTAKLKGYRSANLYLPLGPHDIRDVKFFYVFCIKANQLFGAVPITNPLVPSEQKISDGIQGAHGVSTGVITLKDSRTMIIKDFSYDGAAPDAFFTVGQGNPSTDGEKLPNERGSIVKLPRYQRQTIMLTLPQDKSWADYDYLSVFCHRARQDFAHVRIPRDQLTIPVARGSGPTPSIKYFGKLLGELPTFAHEVRGTVYAANENTVVITNFYYDGEGPDAHFWVGTTGRPTSAGIQVANEVGSHQKLQRYRDAYLVLTLPEGKKITDFSYFGVWCKQATADFGHIKIPHDFSPPREVSLGPIPTYAHGTSADDVIVKDFKTLFIKNLKYDGAGPDAFFLVGRGQAPTPNGIKVPDERGSLSRLHGYYGEDITIRLPPGVSVFDIDYFGLYCIRYTENFGHVNLRQEMLNVPTDIMALKSEILTFDNCEDIIPDHLQVSWKIDGQNIFFRLNGRADPEQYISFGISGKRDRTTMEHADVAVAYYDKKISLIVLKDYFLESRAQCSTNGGVCPDEHNGGRNDLTLISSEYRNGIIEVVYSRPLATNDLNDRNIPAYGDTAIVAAIGPWSDSIILKHTKYVTRDTIFINFGRPPINQCLPLSNRKDPAVAGQPFAARKIKNVNKFTAQIGPTGGSKGYVKITGQEGWGIAWWINGQLIPELHVVRGHNYTFVVEGGLESTNTAKYHPFYITNSPAGGGANHIEELNSDSHKVYAGIDISPEGKVTPATGRYCEWKHKTIDLAEEVDTFEEYKATLRLQCDPGQPGTFFWTPDGNTPNTVYYQCFTHSYLGWKIRVLNEGENSSTSRSAGISLLTVALIFQRLLR
ncbi:protein Skeletor, isoforms B/C-like isoform X2 [Varroa destructor]|uniref:Protein Skeletor n=1 Tax=Varroa destructor TaxID=109461 RepID=A0A7M7KDD7_VARDE|nr:protein Skeletor, isoforms B/C-like isoform X2 [Varroa destructor]